MKIKNEILDENRKSFKNEDNYEQILYQVRKYSHINRKTTTTIAFYVLYG